MDCNCTPETSLFDLCRTCADKAWHDGNLLRKQDPRFNTYEEHGPLLVNRDGKFYRESRLK